jgi:molybdate transport system substrate-binding protein
MAGHSRSKNGVASLAYVPAIHVFLRRAAGTTSTSFERRPDPLSSGRHLSQPRERHMKLFIATAVIGAAFCAASATAAEIKVLSAGAVEPGLVRAVAAFKKASGTEVKIQFNTAPQLAKKLADGEVADVLVAPPGVLDAQAKENKIAAEGRVMVGRVGAGVVMRANATAPDIATTEALKKAVLAADSIVYNTASTGLYIEKVLDKLGIAGEVKAKTTRYPNGEGVMEHVIKSKGNEIGFGAITEIKLFESKGLKLVGPLPSDIQNYTSYGAAQLSNSTSKDAAKAFLAFLTTPEAKQIFAGAGIE